MSTIEGFRVLTHQGQWAAIWAGHLTSEQVAELTAGSPLLGYPFAFGPVADRHSWTFTIGPCDFDTLTAACADWRRRVREVLP